MQAFFESKMFSSESSLRMDFASVMLHLTRRHLPELALGNGHVHAIIRTDNDERERGGRAVISKTMSTRGKQGGGLEESSDAVKLPGWEPDILLSDFS